MKKFLIVALTLAVSSATAFAATTTFPDVDSSDWFYQGVTYSAEHDLMTGYEDGTFGPMDEVNRAQLATVLERMDAEKIDQMYAELAALRAFDLKNLEGATWDEYHAQMWRFPTAGVQTSPAPLELRMYEEVKDYLIAFATDEESGVQLMVQEGVDYIESDVQPFFLYSGAYFNTYFGPFYDDVDRLKTEMEAA